MIRGAIHDAQGRWLISTVWRTTSGWERMRGLLGRPALTESQGLLIAPCRAVHTLFMPVPIDLVFLDGDYVVRKLARTVKPWRFAGCRQALMTLELAGNEIDRLGITIDTQLQWQLTSTA